VDALPDTDERLRTLVRLGVPRFDDDDDLEVSVQHITVDGLLDALIERAEELGNVRAACRARGRRRKRDSASSSVTAALQFSFLAERNEGCAAAPLHDKRRKGVATTRG
jgi:hypothetical protein